MFDSSNNRETGLVYQRIRHQTLLLTTFDTRYIKAMLITLELLKLVTLFDIGLDLPSKIDE